MDGLCGSTKSGKYEEKICGPLLDVQSMIQNDTSPHERIAHTVPSRLNDIPSDTTDIYKIQYRYETDELKIGYTNDRSIVEVIKFIMKCPRFESWICELISIANENLKSIQDSDGGVLRPDNYGEDRLHDFEDATPAEPPHHSDDEDDGD
jgi:hypothetical protein